MLCGIGRGHAGLSGESMTNPFTYEVPVLVSEVRLVMHEKQVWIKDSNEYLIPLTLGEAGKLKGFAVTGGREFTGSSLPGSGHGECYRYG
ncbi:MAG: hypothetical protein V8R91_03630 [Butyricimonas faecihominis]